MAHLLYRFGAAALLRRQVGERVLPPRIPYQEAMKLREQFYAAGQEWPYEHIVPGMPKMPAGAEQYLARQKAKQDKRAARAKEIQDAMTKMPKLIADYKASRKLDWEEVSQLDKLTLTRREIHDKYIRRRLTKQGQQ